MEHSGTGLGFKYDTQIVDISLDWLVAGDTDFLTDEKREFFKRTISTDRINTKLKQSEKVYSGGWYAQSGESTCLPWAVANSLTVLGTRPDNKFMADLLNYANDIEESKRKGMTYDDVLSIFRKYQSTGVHVVLVAHDLELQRINPHILMKNFVYKLTDDDRIPEEREQDLKVQNEQKKVETIRHNGTLIKNIIDGNSVIITTVVTKPYAGVKEQCLHAICIAGYKVNDTGAMNVQIIDSARGKIWMSLEHISTALLSSSLFPSLTFRIKGDGISK